MIIVMMTVVSITLMNNNVFQELVRKYLPKIHSHLEVTGYTMMSNFLNDDWKEDEDGNEYGNDETI